MNKTKAIGLVVMGLPLVLLLFMMMATMGFFKGVFIFLVAIIISSAFIGMIATGSFMVAKGEKEDIKQEQEEIKEREAKKVEVREEIKEEKLNVE